MSGRAAHLTLGCAVAVALGCASASGPATEKPRATPNLAGAPDDASPGRGPEPTAGPAVEIVAPNATAPTVSVAKRDAAGHADDVAEPDAVDPVEHARARLAELALALRSAPGQGDVAREMERARIELAEALPRLARRRGEDDPLVREVALALGRLEAARQERERTTRRSARRRRAAELTRSGLDLAGEGRRDEAVESLERAVALHEADSDLDGGLALGTTLSYLGRLRADRGDPEAEALLVRSLALVEPALGRLDPLTLATRARLERLRAHRPDPREDSVEAGARGVAESRGSGLTDAP